MPPSRTASRARAPSAVQQGPGAALRAARAACRAGLLPRASLPTAELLDGLSGELARNLKRYSPLRWALYGYAALLHVWAITVWANWA